MDEERDRREVSPYVVRVEPALVGNALAAPWRRGMAMVVDGMAIAVLANAPSVFLGVAAAYVLLRATARKIEGGRPRRVVLGFARYGTAVVAFVLAARALGFVERVSGRADDPERAVTTVEAAVAEARLTGREGLLAGSEIVAFALANDEEDAFRHAGRVQAQLREAGLGEAQIVELLDEIGEEQPERPWLDDVVDSLEMELLAAEQRRRVEQKERLDAARGALLAYARAVEAGDSAGADSLRAGIAPALAGDTVELLSEALRRERAQSAELEERLRDTRDDLEEARDASGLMGILRNLREDLGLGLGWSGLYFTAFLVLWRGQTPGKRLTRIRVVRVDGKPMGWWASFERFGGYAAGFATGLLGFLQVFWDRNRQAVHDKISETVVVRD